jgi:hypothetical protein
VLALAGLAFVVDLHATRLGIGLSPDSASYLAGGASLIGGHGYSWFDGKALTTFPPGYSSLVVVAHVLGVDPGVFLRYLNALMAGGIVVLTYVLLRRHVRSRVVQVAGTAIVACSPAILNVADMAWSEATFIAISLGMFLLMEKLLTAPRSIGLIAGIVGLTWLGFLFRYAGVVLLVVDAAVILIALRQLKLKELLLRAGAYLAIVALVPLAWMARDLAADGTLFGPRGSSRFAAPTIVDQLFTNLAQLFLPHRLQPGVSPSTGAPAATIGVLVLVLAVGGIAIFASRRGQWLCPQGPLVLMLYVIIYSGYLAFSEATTSLDAIDTRLVTPLWVPILVLASMGVDELCRVERVRRHRVLIALGGVAVLACVGTQLWVATADANNLASHAAGYRSSIVQSPGWERTLSSLPTAKPILSNDQYLAWLELEASSGGTITDHEYTVEAAPESATGIDAQLCGDPYILWYDNGSGPYLSIKSLHTYAHFRYVLMTPTAQIDQLDPFYRSPKCRVAASGGAG